MCRSRGSIFLALAATAIAAAQAQSPMTIKIIEGDHAINSIRMKRGHDPVVQVLSGSGEPIAGATVSFLLPASGAGATFSDGGLSLTVQSDAKGMAVGRHLTPNRIEGPFRIRVTASSHGEAASAALSQTNAEPAVKSSRSKWIVIAVAAGGALAGGVVAASHGGGSSSSDTSGGSTGGGSGGGAAGATAIVPGSPSFGPPK
jgi:hypothetical protein